MNRSQKIIKYAAMLFGILLAGTIVAGVVGLVIKGISHVTGQELAEIDYERSFSEEEIQSIEVVNYDGKMRFAVGEEFRVVGTRVPETFGAEISGGTLCIYYSEDNSWFSGSIFHVNDFDDAEIVITVPEGFVAKKLTVKNGAGEMEVSGLLAEEFYADNGSGSITLRELNVSEAELRMGSGACRVDGLVAEYMEVYGGSGRISMENVKIAGGKVKTGSGGFELEGAVNGSLSVKTGSGSATLELENKRAEYDISVREGSGGVWLDGEKCGDYQEKHEDASYTMSLDTGSGRVAVEFEE